MAERIPKEAPETGFYVYQHPSLGWKQYWLDRVKLLSVSKVKEAIGQGDGLMTWYGREERKGMIEVAVAVYRDALSAATDAAAQGATLAALPDPEMFRSRLWLDVPNALFAETTRDEAADIGKEVHAAIEWWFKNGLFRKGFGPKPPAPSEFSTPEAEVAFKAAIEFMSEEDVVPLAVEREVYSRRLGVGGTLDKIALIRGVPAIVDWKATKSIRYTQRVTTCAYGHLYNDCPEKVGGVDRVDRALVIRLPKTAADRIEFVPMGPDEFAEHGETLATATKLRRILDSHSVFDWKPTKK